MRSTRWIPGASLALIIIVIVALLPIGGGPRERTARVAVAANFARTADALGARLEETTSWRVELIVASTGMLDAQIRQGAPFDVFLAADARRPEQLVADGFCTSDGTITYAVGTLVLWSSEPGNDPQALLMSGEYEHVALANPALAPYGSAARETLVGLEVWEDVSKKAVYGENVSQACQLVRTGNAALGFVALSNLVVEPSWGERWIIPETMHSPIRQKAVRLTEHPAARAFLDLLQSSEGRAIIEQHGYRLP